MGNVPATRLLSHHPEISASATKIKQTNAEYDQHMHILCNYCIVRLECRVITREFRRARVHGLDHFDRSAKFTRHEKLSGSKNSGANSAGCERSSAHALQSNAPGALELGASLFRASSLALGAELGAAVPCASEGVQVHAGGPGAHLLRRTHAPETRLLRYGRLGRRNRNAQGELLGNNFDSCAVNDLWRYVTRWVDADTCGCAWVGCRCSPTLCLLRTTSRTSPPRSTTSDTRPRTRDRSACMG